MKSTKRILTLTLVLLLGLSQPVAILADGTTDPSTTTPAVTTPADPATTTPADPVATPPADPTPPATTTGPTNPTGPTSPTGPQNPTGPTKPTGKIPAYAFNDATQTWVATNQGSFSYNTGIGRYESPLYSYDAQSGWYHLIPGAVMPAPASSGFSGSSGGTSGAPSSSGVAGSTSAAGASNPLATLAALLGLSDPSNSSTGPGSTNTSSASATNNAELQLLTNALLNNNDTSTATTGDASVSGNTTAGDATTGPATVIDNLLNLLNAAWSWSNGGLSYFAQNLFGDQTGDITLNPGATTGGGGQVGSLPSCTDGSVTGNANTGPDSTNTATDTCNNNVNVTNQANGAINNNVNVLAQSGNAAVTNNTQAGNATSGDATADVNILNLINSAISSGQSFFGLLNIFGNLNGDILFPDGFLNGIAGQGSTTGTDGTTTASNANTGPDSTNTANTTQNNTGTVTNDVNSAFNNNINTNAQSGAANVANNTSAGDATTGTATTNNNLFNLDNTTLFGDNAVLVLVNVMGHWVGQIMNLPTTGSSTGALLTGNATVENDGTGPNSTNTASSTQNNNANLTNNVNGTINNNVNAGAISGNADVTGNTSAGNATTGDASVATNVANIFGSQLNLTHWFGVLVINVFGDWTGDVNQNTSAGDAPASAQSGGSGSGGGSSANPAVQVAAALFTAGANSGGGISGFGSSLSAAAAKVSTASPVLGSSTLVAAVHNPETAAKTAARNTGFLLMLAAVTLLLAGAFFGLEQKLKKTS